MVSIIAGSLGFVNAAHKTDAVLWKGLEGDVYRLPCHARTDHAPPERVCLSSRY